MSFWSRLFGGGESLEEKGPDTLRSSQPPRDGGMAGVRIECLQRELSMLVREREIARFSEAARIERCSELLEEAREGRRLVKEYFEAREAAEAWPRDPKTGARLPDDKIGWAPFRESLEAAERNLREWATKHL